MPDLVQFTDVFASLHQSAWLAPFGWTVTLLLLGLVVVILKELERHDHLKLQAAAIERAARARRRVDRAQRIASRDAPAAAADASQTSPPSSTRDEPEPVDDPLPLIVQTRQAPRPLQAKPRPTPAPSPEPAAIAPPAVPAQLTAAPPPPLPRTLPEGVDPFARRVEKEGLQSLAAYRTAKTARTQDQQADDLKRIRGIGTFLERRLNELGITSYRQIAMWSPADVDRINAALGGTDRIDREGWIEQARILAAGGSTAYSRRIDEGARYVPRQGPLTVQPLA